LVHGLEDIVVDALGISAAGVHAFALADGFLQWRGLPELLAEKSFCVTDNLDTILTQEIEDRVSTYSIQYTCTKNTAHRDPHKYRHLIKCHN
jgi:hypothetical protein